MNQPVRAIHQHVAGPRAMLKNQQYREIAEQKMETERQRVRELQNDSPYEALESSSTSAQNDTKALLVRPSCLNVSSEMDLKSMPGKFHNDAAVTYWSHELKTTSKPHFTATPIERNSSLFAKCTSFTNDITDARLRHSED